MSSADLLIGGMTCASCATRVERKLNRLDGVTATVNLVTETASVSFPETLTAGDLIAVVQKTGYTAALSATAAAASVAGTRSEPASDDSASHESASDKSALGQDAPGWEALGQDVPGQDVPGQGRPGQGIQGQDVPGRSAPAGAANRAPAGGTVQLRRRLLVSAALAIPVAVLAMVPALRFPAWQWVSLALTLPVATWGAWPFHRAAAVNARHGAATMDTLVSLGTLAAWTWSLVVLAAGLDADTYFEVGPLRYFQFVRMMRHTMASNLVAIADNACQHLQVLWTPVNLPPVIDVLVPEVVR